jgi:hypothetical protein
MNIKLCENRSQHKKGGNRQQKTKRKECHGLIVE